MYRFYSSKGLLISKIKQDFKSNIKLNKKITFTLLFTKKKFFKC